jgi:hypothetical protein
MSAFWEWFQFIEEKLFIPFFFWFLGAKKERLKNITNNLVDFSLKFFENKMLGLLKNPTTKKTVIKPDCNVDLANVLYELKGYYNANTVLCLSCSNGIYEKDKPLVSSSLLSHACEPFMTFDTLKQNILFGELIELIFRSNSAKKVLKLEINNQTLYNRNELCPLEYNLLINKIHYIKAFHVCYDNGLLYLVLVGWINRPQNIDFENPNMEITDHLNSILSQLVFLIR